MWIRIIKCWIIELRIHGDDGESASADVGARRPGAGVIDGRTVEAGVCHVEAIRAATQAVRRVSANLQIDRRYVVDRLRVVAVSDNPGVVSRLELLNDAGAWRCRDREIRLEDDWLARGIRLIDVQGNAERRRHQYGVVYFLGGIRTGRRRVLDRWEYSARHRTRKRLRRVHSPVNLVRTVADEGEQIKQDDSGCHAEASHLTTHMYVCPTGTKT